MKALKRPFIYLSLLFGLLSLSPGHVDQEIDLRSLDFSPALVPKTEFLGFIGEDKQRIYLQFEGLQQDSANPALYHLSGYSTVLGNRCDFRGILILSEFIPEGDHHGILKGKYLLSEDPRQFHVGTFQGDLWAHYKIDEKGQVQYQEPLASDDYRNNQYQGTWQEYGQAKGKVCNWGEFRIPQSEDLDIGAAEFSPNPKYQEQGW